jgi:hypothetical protein
MNNFGKYKDKIKKFVSVTNDDRIKCIQVTTDEGTVYGKYYEKPVYTYVAFEHFFNWLCQEEPPLKTEEETYLTNLIKPFRDDVVNITKKANDKGYEWLLILIKDNEPLLLPGFEKGTMYKGLELNKNYTPEELGL